jgi:hypothetical protein
MLAQYHARFRILIPESTFNLNADPDPTFHIKVDPDPAPAPRQNDANLRPHASIVSIHGLPWLHFEPIKLLNFDINADPCETLISCYTQL